MHFKNIEDILERISDIKVPRVAAVPAADEAHTLEAVVRAYQENIIEPVLIGNYQAICASLEKIGHMELEKYIMESPDNVTSAGIAVDLARNDKAHLLMKGGLQTAEYLKPVLSSKTGIKRAGTLSSVGFSELPGHHKIFINTDVGLNVKPTLSQKRDIIFNAVHALRSIGHDEVIKVAVLSAAELVNPKAEESVEADALKNMNLGGEIKDCIVEGPISFDLAMDKEAAMIKKYKSPVAGDADILVYPDIASGNIAYKALTYCGMKSIGFVSGAKVPIVLASRASSVEDKYNMLVFCALASM